jgi:capsular polysaccharide biosynthesis protein/GGDEF domain-containing protein
MARIQQYSSLFRRSWWIIALSVLAALNVALILAYFATPIYRASAQFIVGPGPSLLASEDRDLVNSIEALDKRSIVATYAEVMGSRQMRLDAAERLGIERQELSSYKFTSVVLPDASVLELSVEGPDPERVALLANNVGQQAVDYIKSLYLVYDIHMLDSAVTPVNPIRPQPMRDASLAIVLGLVFGLALAVLREQISPLVGTQGILRPAAAGSTPSAFSQSHFQRRMDEQLNKSKAEPLALGLVQLKGLQDLVETLPAPVLQRLRLRVTEILHSKLQSDETLGYWDESSFAVLLPGANGTAALQRLEHIQQALAEPVVLDPEGEIFDLKPHVGLAVRQEREPAELLIKKAEAALTETYRNGSKTIVFNHVQPVNGTAHVLNKGRADRGNS